MNVFTVEKQGKMTKKKGMQKWGYLSSNSLIIMV